MPSEKEEFADELAALTHELRVRGDLERVRMVRLTLKMWDEWEREGQLRRRDRP